MAGARSDVAAELSRIEQESPGWHPWVSDGGRWWATRQGTRPANPPSEWALTVDADDGDGLRKQIAAQDQLAGLAGA